jgi:hypothetical protein
MSVVDTVSVVLLDEYAPEKDDNSPFPGITWIVLAVVVVALVRKRDSQHTIGKPQSG